MTLVGKILVIVIMIFAMVFLGISTVVFTTHTNWKEATAKEQDKVKAAQKKLEDAKGEIALAKKGLEASQAEHATAKKSLEDRNAALETELKTAQEESTKARTALGNAEQNSKIALEEASSRKEETDKLRGQKSEVEKQANEYKIRQTELNDKIRELERMLQTATTNAKDLKERVARFSAFVRSKGYSDDVSQYKALESPPAVEGEIIKADNALGMFEISIGSNDGLVPGHELYLFRTKPRAEFLGKVRVKSVDPNQATVQMIGKPVNGKKIQEGDLVSSTIKPRS